MKEDVETGLRLMKPRTSSTAGGYNPIIAGANNTGVLSIAFVGANIATSTNDVFSDIKPDKHQK